jgi:hypothetical protein
VIHGVAYDSSDQTFPVGAGGMWEGDDRGGDTAVCAGVTASGDGAIAGDFCREFPGSDAVLCGLQIVGTFPRQRADIVNLDINGYYTGQDSPPVPGDTYSGAARVGSDGDYWNRVTVGDATVANITVPHLKCTDGLNNSTVNFSMSRVGEGTLGADHIYEAPLNPLLDDYVYAYGETLRFTLSGLVPNTAYDLYFYCHAGLNYNPARFVINGVDYFSFDKCFPGGQGGDYAVCAGIIADGSGVITGDFLAASPPAAGVLNGLQVMGTIPRLPLGTVFTLH